MKKFSQITLAIALGTTAFLSACDSDSSKTTTPTSEVVLKNHSVTPTLLKMKSGFENVQTYSLIGSDDQLTESPNYVFGGSADGSGLLKSGDNYVLLVNQEDNYAVSRITLDKTFKPVKGEYLLNSTGAQWRLCGATLATQAEHGFGPLYLTCGESGEESRTHGINPFDAVSSATKSRELVGLGRTSAENALPLSKNAYAGKTVIVIGDDDSGAYGGQVFVYMSNTVGDLDNGDLYMLKRTDSNQKEKDMAVGQNYVVEFVKVENHKTLTGRQINERVDVLKAVKFGRVEDVDYRKGSAANNREIYFNVTGQNTTGVNADASRTKYGRVYRLKLDATTPLKGTLEVILDGNDKNGKAKTFQNPDNLMTTENYVYVQEDANGYGDETHDAYIYQYSIATGELKTVLELDHRRTATDAAKYNVGKPSAFGDWEFGALIDISDVIGVPNTFALSVQPHTWTGDKYKGVDGGALRVNENQASQIVILKGLAK